MSSAKPAIVIVPGAWHIPAHYSDFEAVLTSTGYEVTTCSMPSAGPKEPLPDMSQDVAVIRKAIQSYLDRGLNVVLVTHSLGGFIGTSASKGLRPEDQTNGKGVISLVYIAAFPLPEGATLLDPEHPVHAPWVRLTGKSGTGVFMVPDNPPFEPKEVFYNDCAPEVQEKALKLLEEVRMEHSENVLYCPCEYSAWKEIESNYLVCERDNALPAAAQEGMAAQEGGRWRRVERIDAGHSPFLSRPRETAEFVRRCAGEELLS